MYAIFMGASGAIGSTHLPIGREKVTVRAAVNEYRVMKGRMITPAVLDEAGDEIEPAVYADDWIAEVEVQPAVTRDETTDEMISRLSTAGHLPDAPWQEWLTVPSDSELAGADPARLTVGDWADAGSVTIAPPTHTQADYTVAIRAHVEAVARARQYDNAHSLASYVTSSVPTWAAEAQAFVAWRDQVWVYAYQQLAAVQSGARAQPTPAEFVSELPAITWPA